MRMYFKTTSPNKFLPIHRLIRLFLGLFYNIEALPFIERNSILKSFDSAIFNSFTRILRQKFLLIGGILFLSGITFMAVNEFLSKNEVVHAWFYESLNIEEEEMCNREEPSPLVIISFDGFAEEYLQRRILKNLDLMASRGVRAQHVKPVFPSKTLPNHYTMMTGLYPGYHGIVENWIYDPNLSNDFVDVRKTHLYDFYTYGGEPIWATYRRETKKRVSCLFYPGCYHYPKHRPDVTEIFENVPMEHVFDKVTAEILKPKELRPGLVIGYINEPDETRHLAKQDSQEVTAILQRLESAIGQFFNRLHKAKKLSCTNIIFISDHGFINQGKVVNATRLDIPYKYAFGDAIARYYLDENGPSTDQVIKDLDSDHQRLEFRAYNRSTLPPRFHYGVAKRVGDIIITGEPGTRVGFYPYPKLPRVNLGSNHGWDYILSEMNTIFFGMGPSFKRGHILSPFQVIEYYNLFADLLGIPPQLNNGTRGLLRSALKESIDDIDPLYKEDKPIRECENEFQKTVNFPLEQDGTFKYCFHRSTDQSFYIKTNEDRITIEIVNPKDFDESRSDLNFISSDQRSLGIKNDLKNREFLHFTANREFLASFWKALEEKTKQYVNHFGRLVIITGHHLEKNQDQVDSYFYRIFIRCDQSCTQDGFYCQDQKDLQTLAFLAPHPLENFNKLTQDELLIEYTARLRDIEVMTGIRFLNDRQRINYHESIQRKTYITTMLW